MDGLSDLPGNSARDSLAAGDGSSPESDGSAPTALPRYEGDTEIERVSASDFDEKHLIGAYRMMLTARRLDQKMLTLLRQGKGNFHIGCSGHEAVQIGVGQHLNPGSDRILPYYRDLCTMLTIGEPIHDVLLHFLSKRDDPYSGGRQMPAHYSNKEHGVFSVCSAVGSQFLPSLGFSMAAQRRGSDDLVVCSCGEGATSQGSFHEALNWSARTKMPVLFFVQDNRYAISVHRREQTAGGSVYKVVQGYDNLARMHVDGTDFFASWAAAKAATERIRAGEGPVCLVAEVVRLLPHSSSDDHSKYRSQEELDQDREIDPITRLRMQLIEAEVMTREEAENLDEEVQEEINQAARWALDQEDVTPDEATRFVYSQNPSDIPYKESYESDGDPVVMVDAINHALHEEMESDDSVLVYGEDVAGEKGGVFTATKGLTAAFGEDRCFNSPLSENSIVGTAVGLAAEGYRPVVEIQFADYIWPAMQQLRNQVPTVRYRSNNEWSSPIVIRVPVGGYIHGGLCHSQNIEAIFGHMPGYSIVFPSTAADAKGLLKTAIRTNDPVLFLEHKALYRHSTARTPEPDDDYFVPFGKARTVQEGTDLTIITYGLQVYKAQNVAQMLKKEGASVEIIDIRSIYPLDKEHILNSVKKTNRALILYEDHEFMGFGAEISSQIADDAFTYLDAPIRRVGGEFTPIPFSEVLENAVLPQDETILEEARDVLSF